MFCFLGGGLDSSSQGVWKDREWFHPSTYKCKIHPAGLLRPHRPFCLLFASPLAYAPRRWVSHSHASWRVRVSSYQCLISGMVINSIGGTIFPHWAFPKHCSKVMQNQGSSQEPLTSKTNEMIRQRDLINYGYWRCDVMSFPPTNIPEGTGKALITDTEEGFHHSTGEI